jgi:hypothetical protein
MHLKERPETPEKDDIQCWDIEIPMPHTTTKVARLKRVDVRPNAKQRKAMFQVKEKSMKIQDLRVVRKSTSQKIPREVGGELLLETSRMKRRLNDDSSKLVKALRKKLKSIEDLILQQKAGAILDDQQLKKIASLDTVLTEMESFAVNESKATVD